MGKDKAGRDPMERCPSARRLLIYTWGVFLAWVALNQALGVGEGSPPVVKAVKPPAKTPYVRELEALLATSNKTDRKSVV